MIRKIGWRRAVLYVFNYHTGFWKRQVFFCDTVLLLSTFRTLKHMSSKYLVMKFLSLQNLFLTYTMRKKGTHSGSQAKSTQIRLEFLISHTTCPPFWDDVFFFWKIILLQYSIILIPSSHLVLIQNARNFFSIWRLWCLGLSRTYSAGKNQLLSIELFFMYVDKI